MEALPLDYKIVENPNYIIRKGDKFLGAYTKSWSDCKSTVGGSVKQAISRSITKIATKISMDAPIENKLDLPPLPADYEILQDSGNYKLNRGDKFINFTEKTSWDTVSNFAGYTPNVLIRRYGYDLFIVATKRSEPRFKTDKPFPWGY